MTRRTACALAVVLGLAVAAPAWSKPNFSGSWSLNAGKSNFGPMPAPEKLERKITHEDPSLKMTTTQSGPQGEVTADITYKTDGSESVNKIRGMDVKAVVKWEGDALKVSSKREIQGMEISQNETWTLSPDGKVLTIVNKVSTPQGDIELTIVLDKK